MNAQIVFVLSKYRIEIRPLFSIFAVRLHVIHSVTKGYILLAVQNNSTS